MVQFIKADPLSVGALVTTHKIDLLRTCRDLFETLDFYAQATGEISCLSKRGGALHGYAKDPISSGLTLEAFVPAGHWRHTGAEVLVLGAGGSGVAVTAYLLDAKHGDNRPARILVADRNPERLHEAAAIRGRFPSPVPVEYRQVTSAADNDRLMDTLPPRSLVINATGLGKDAPARRSPPPRASPKAVTSGSSTTAATCSFSTRPGRRPPAAVCTSRTAGSTSCMAGPR